MRLDKKEKEALRFALKGFEGETYIFGSRLDNGRRGGDIDILLIPQKEVNPLKLSLGIQRRFFSRCEQSIDVLVYNESLFCKEALKNAERIDISRI